MVQLGFTSHGNTEEFFKQPDNSKNNDFNISPFGLQDPVQSPSTYDRKKKGMMMPVLSISPKKLEKIKKNI